MNFDDLNLDALKGKTEEVKKLISDKFGEITDGEASELAKKPGQIFDFVKEKFNVEKEEFTKKFEGFNFDEFKDGVTFDEVKDKFGEVVDRLKK